MTTYVDVLAAPDYLIVDTLSFDDTFWAANQAQLNADAKKYGKELSPRTAAPSYASTPITSIGQFDARMQLTDTSGAPAGAFPGTPAADTWIIIGGVAAAGLFGLALWLLRSKKKR